MYTMLPCVFVYFLILCSILTVRCGVCESVTDFVRNHSFVFISGWPQSGTSLVHQILSFHKSVSSMISSCERIIGTKHCVGFNHEGQWILPGYVRSPFRSGEFCRIDEIHSINASSIVREWGRFWSLHKPVLIEKSPQSFLKINLLQTLFSNSLGTKFVIVLKHPVTLNIATPKNIGWRYHNDLGTMVALPSSSTKPPTMDKKQITSKQMSVNANFFLDFMNGGNSSMTLKCSTGWLPGMEQLFQLLDSSNTSRLNVRIVRHEQFSRPIPICLSIVNFLFGEMNRERSLENLQFCNSLFSNKIGVASTPAERVIAPLANRRQKTTPRQLFEEILVHRNLRLRGAERGFQFHSMLVGQRGRERIGDFLFAYNMLPRGLQMKLDRVDEQMSKYGYKMMQFGFHSQSSVFKDWEFH